MWGGGLVGREGSEGKSLAGGNNKKGGAIHNDVAPTVRGGKRRVIAGRKKGVIICF